MQRLERLAAQVQQYLADVLGVSASSNQPWGGQDGLPYFLLDGFEFRQLRVLSTPVLLALDRNPGRLTIADIGKRLRRVQSQSGRPVAYVTDSLASYQRKRLIEQKSPFVVPGNQLYWPELGVDLREYFRRRVTASDLPLSPSAQAILISCLLRPRWEPEWHPAEVALSLGYTPMTLSRAVREFTAAGLATAHKAGRTQYLTMTHAARETWERAVPLLRSPVRKTAWVRMRTTAKPPLRLAGLSALARLSMLGEPGLPAHAIAQAEWQRWKTKVEVLPEAMPGAKEWQVWNYSPALQPDSPTVDPLSLMLSLKDNSDERVQSALDSLAGQLPW